MSYQLRAKSKATGIRTVICAFPEWDAKSRCKKQKRILEAQFGHLLDYYLVHVKDS